jgi:hypothetical protein
LALARPGNAKTHATYHYRAMQAVWSFWTKPYLAERRSSWYRDWHHWLACGLSVHTARQHYPDTLLVTDDEGARILVDELQLPFERVSTALNALERANAEWWALGKIEAYRCQREPFIHIDTDVFLWKPLAAELESADVFAQNPEPITLGASCYRPEELEHALRFPARGWLPKEWIWYRRQSAAAPRAECCGIFGGCAVDFINHYAETALRLLRDARNRAGLRTFPGKIGHMILIEQYLLTACIEYHREHRQSPFHGIEIRYVFNTIGEAFRPECATAAGFTHLAAGAKRSARVARDLERRVRDELPDHYERCENLLRRQFSEALS